MITLDTVLCRIPGVIERDSLIAFLSANGIPARSVDRAVLVKLGNESNLTWGGYSALDEGYPVFVAKEHEAEAKNLLVEFRRRTEVKEVEEPENDFSKVDSAGRYFFICSFWSMALPLIANIAALYWLMRSRNVVKLRPKATAFWILWNIAGAYVGVLIEWPLIERIFFK